MSENLAQVVQQVLVEVSGLISRALAEDLDGEPLLDVVYRPNWEATLFEHLLSLSMYELEELHEELMGETVPGCERPEISRTIQGYLRESGELKSFCHAHCSDIEMDPVLQHWIVTPELAKQLLEQGEVACQWQGLWIWGRCTAGQAVEDDACIRRIAGA